MARKEILILVVITFLTFMAWVIFDIIHTRTQVTIDPTIQEATAPLEPTFDQSAIQLLQP
ncbi:MAG: hypothetical protein HYW45_01655 [Candidatus Daviesbacteria bacterium]|nr:MAG: hypothetical protein HYW45_01655 [Candidatus Daviesbacteria bacterium]